eukprot:scaffold3981_cov302-Prasinococcus_capsulatus_cf.AAC.1
MTTTTITFRMHRRSPFRSSDQPPAPSDAHPARGAARGAAQCKGDDATRPLGLLQGHASSWKGEGRGACWLASSERRLPPSRNGPAGRELAPPPSCSAAAGHCLRKCGELGLVNNKQAPTRALHQPRGAAPNWTQLELVSSQRAPAQSASLAAASSHTCASVARRCSRGTKPAASAKTESPSPSARALSSSCTSAARSGPAMRPEKAMRSGMNRCLPLTPSSLPSALVHFFQPSSSMPGSSAPSACSSATRRSTSIAPASTNLRPPSLASVASSG